MTKQKAICLISDGLDSPVATFLTEQKGLEVIGINFDNKPLITFTQNEKFDEKIEPIKNQITNIASALVKAFKEQNEFNLYIIPNGQDLKHIVDHTKDPQIICVLCKRLMLKKAEQVAVQLDADFIVTGEILGEQASQTIDNLRNVESVLKTKQLLRPLIGLNKEEVINISRKIGTNTFSELSAKYNCAAVPNKPATHAISERIIEAEVMLNSQISRDILTSSQKFTFYK
ncbi:MAG: tRNA 4-thiouridine(8) synthase ThiI [Candidatus Heimdallarchaeota archaeon]|nr:tRNA 4-thiouridine(8) synthase ThiI [Candidatus Heimdallarchaeota archaeon]